MSRHSQHSISRDPTFTARARSTWEVVRRVAVYLRPYRWMALGTVGCAVLSLAFSFAFPKLTQFTIDEVIGHRRHDLLAPVMLALLGAFLLRDLFNSFRILINNTFEQNVIYDMRRAVYERLQRLPVNYFDQRASGDLMTRVIEDVNAVERVLIDGTEQGTVAILGIIGVLAILFCTNATLTWVAMVPLPLLSGGALWYTLTAHRRYRRQREAASAMNALLMDNLQGIRQIKVFGREPHEDARFAQRADDLRRGTLGVMRVWAMYSPAMSYATALGMALVLWIGGRQVLAGLMSLGQLVGFLFYLSLFYEPVARLHGLNQMLQAARAAGERVFDILDATEERPPVVGDAAARRHREGPRVVVPKSAESRMPSLPVQSSEARPSSDREVVHEPGLTRPSATLSHPMGEGRGEGPSEFRAPTRGGKAPEALHETPTHDSLVELPRVRGEVVYEHVGFSYGGDRVVLRDLNLHARPGEMIALVGPTGAGKSTLVNLLPAFYELTAGRITIDGCDTSGIQLDSLRAQIAVVSQEPFLFNGTVRENILYGKLDAGETELLAAARAANCHEFINHLPRGYDSHVGERGVKLSVGEKQRVSIARALLKNAPILILDEATASVDTATERLIQEALERLMAGRTSFVIAHRLSTIRRADQILVLRHGEIVERGTHEELLGLGGLYARLARIQNTTFIEEGFEKLSAD